MSKPGRGWSLGVRLGAAITACVTWSAPVAHAASSSAATSTADLTSASWGVVITQSSTPPYVPGPAVTISASVVGARYYTVANTGSRLPGSITYRLNSSLGLSVTLETCPTPWSGLGLCATTPTPVTANTAQSAASGMPPVGGVLYLKVLVLVAGSATLYVEATRPDPVVVNA